ncbi:hypothetical protein HYFRA_00011131 [Hymenoscyphus fraxineus]|uniref:LipA and NB-ARC domain protein n=1 Tax=Hymenoscyphus fraxineus TaxID=746836 RepID=A0A9N9L2U0_9HELO|nr:hypothetical protein HYFRA_00011131 [Hymenoscyphus fraxineus]
MSINRKPVPTGPPPPYYENGFNETHRRHDDSRFEQEQEQEQQQPLREDGRQRRWDGEMWRQPLSQLENWSQSQLENWNQRQAANNNRPVPMAFTELPENQPFPQRPVPAQNPQSFPNSPNGSSGSFPQQPTGEPSYRYLSFPKSPAQNKFSPTTDHHQPSPISEQYHYASSEARSPSLQPPSRDHDVTQQVPATHQSSTPPLTESRIRDSDSLVSSQFKVQRKPLRSYKSSPAVNTLAQRGGAVSADTQRAWDVQAEKLIRNNTFNVTPLSQRVPGSSQGTQQFQSHNQPYPTQEPHRPDLSVKTSIPPHMMDSNPYLSRSTVGGSNLSVSSPNTRPSTASSSVNFGESTNSLSTTITSTDTTITETSSTTKTKFNPAGAVQDAFREARHFAGGLIHHPATSTKHFSILRHSHGLVFYQGPNTSLTISLFASEPMPATRRIYLQPKGWSGGTGMRIKQLVGATNSWLDVTPNLCISAEQLNPRDERAWQRDIKSFNKRREKMKKIQKHLLRETTVIRIPSDAGDGYFQLILCLDGVKQKVLCTSPTFRLLSLSTSPSSMRGASLSTMPMEMGIKAVEIYAAKVAGPAAMLAQSKILSRATKASEKLGVLNKASKVQEKVERVGKHVPKGFLEKAAQMVEGASGADDAKAAKTSP